MEEENKEEKKTDEVKKEESKPVDTGEGDKSKTDEEVKRLNAETEGIKKAIAENENAKARQAMSGVTMAGGQEKKPVSEEEQKADRASKFWGDSALGDAVRKVSNNA